MANGFDLLVCRVLCEVWVDMGGSEGRSCPVGVSVWCTKASCMENISENVGLPSESVDCGVSGNSTIGDIVGFGDLGGGGGCCWEAGASEMLDTEVVERTEGVLERLVGALGLLLEMREGDLGNVRCMFPESGELGLSFFFTATLYFSCASRKCSIHAFCKHTPANKNSPKCPFKLIL